MAEHGQLYLKQRPRLCHPEVIQLEMKSFVGRVSRPVQVMSLWTVVEPRLTSGQSPFFTLMLA